MVWLSTDVDDDDDDRSDRMVCVVQKSPDCTLPVYECTKFKLRFTNTFGDLFQGIASKFNINEDDFEIESCALQVEQLSTIKDKTLNEAGITDEKMLHDFIISDSKTHTKSSKTCDVTNSEAEWNWIGNYNTVPETYNDELLLGASASPTAVEGPQNLTDQTEKDTIGLSIPVSEESSVEDDVKETHSVPYVGLVNQAMTCYLNSLLQALYMTPEFRNALYNWEFRGTDPSTSIPYQLQTLFLNLQTSTKSAVETIELTHSFGWDLREAWQQHDIQELCRVMFDALEQTFKDTSQADLINRLYQGKMIDYVKCLECKTEKAREDMFLDIPLPVRPFGSTVAYGSVEEALRAFVQPETLDGNNQYFCDKCNKKCDAHKGLKFSKIPYLLTLHLKRFDFDYSTMHRIKLNDKVTFPEMLNLNSFVCTKLQDDTMISEPTDELSATRCDDSSTTDSGSALDDESCQGTDVTTITQNSSNTTATGLTSISNNSQDPAALTNNIASSSNHVGDSQEDDEGIDLSTGQENEKNRRHVDCSKGPYVYELFSIMIHSGSASGGHYYAYIKDFAKNKWFCFDDQTVSKITYDDIQKTYGGGIQRSYYSGAFRSSTNAYMLMYRQVDKERNCSAMSTEEFPPHIQKLLQMIQAQENTEKDNYLHDVIYNLKYYYNHPINQALEKKLFVLQEYTWDEVTKEVYKKLKLTVPIECCRLVAYNKTLDTVEVSLEDRLQDPICDIFESLKQHKDYLFEVRSADEKFLTYKPGCFYINAYIMTMEPENFDGPFPCCVYENLTMKDLKGVLLDTLKLNEELMRVAMFYFNGETYQPQLVSFDDKELQCYMSKSRPMKIFVTEMKEEEFEAAKFFKLINRFDDFISLTIYVPQFEEWILKLLAIPALDVNQNCNNKTKTTTTTTNAEIGSGEPTVTADGKVGASVLNKLSDTEAPAEELTEMYSTTVVNSDQSNSEDSSLSDSDRTLVGDAPDECQERLSSPSNSSVASDHSEDLHSADLEENIEDTANTSTAPKPFFKATEVPSRLDYLGRTIQVLIDKHTTIQYLKTNLEPYVGVPADYFKIFKQDVERTNLYQTLYTFPDGTKFNLKYGRILKENEFSGKLYQLDLNSSEPMTFLRDWVIAVGETVLEVKKAIIRALGLDLPLNRCRLRRKSWRNPSNVYFDDQKFCVDIMIHSNWEILVQKLPEPEKVFNADQMLLFVRRWCPSTLEFNDLEEVVIDEMTVAELKEKLSERSGIPVENLDYALLKVSFPYRISLLGVDRNLEWNPNAVNLSSWPLQIEDGYAFAYRDNREPIKQLTFEEKKEIQNTESANSTSFRYVSLRRERALKIYYPENPPKTTSTTNDTEECKN